VIAERAGGERGGFQFRIILSPVAMKTTPELLV
jgi:hypothetical protein